METEQVDFPLEELMVTAGEVIDQGGIFWLKFTCSNCGSRQTCAEKNTFFKKGQCEECNFITNIEEKGGNLLVTLIIK